MNESLPSDKLVELLIQQVGTLSGQVAALSGQVAQNTSLVGRLEERLAGTQRLFEERAGNACPYPGMCETLSDQLKGFVAEVRQAQAEHEERVRVLEDERQQRQGAEKKQLQMVGLVGLVSGLLGALSSPMIEGVLDLGHSPASQVQKVNETAR